MLAAVIDILQMSNWQRAGKKSAPKPKPLRRPGDINHVGTSMDSDAFDKMYAKATGRIERGEVAWRSK
jgi:arginase family enzyme